MVGGKEGVDASENNGMYIYDETSWYTLGTKYNKRLSSAPPHSSHQISFIENLFVVSSG